MKVRAVFGLEFFLGKFVSISSNVRKCDFERIALRHRSNAMHFLRRNRFVCGARGGNKAEGNAIYFCILGIEEAMLIRVVIDTSQPATDNLLAQQLSAKRTYAEDVRDRVCIPSFGEH